MRVLRSYGSNGSRHSLRQRHGMEEIQTMIRGMQVVGTAENILFAAMNGVSVKVIWRGNGLGIECKDGVALLGLF